MPVHRKIVRQSQLWGLGLEGERKQDGTGERGQAFGESVAGDHDGHLADRVLVKELGHKLLGTPNLSASVKFPERRTTEETYLRVLEGEIEPGGFVVSDEHGGREVDDEVDMADDAALDGSRIAEDAVEGGK